jgi:EAL domain-containing protein (putative c-di-GMP-specific phosphodiesterase class I)
VIAWQNHSASRLHNGLLWALGAICGTALTTSLARVFAPEAGLWSTILSSVLVALLIWAVAPKATTITPPTAHELNSAFENQQIQPYFQTQVSLKDEQITGIEALASCQHPSHGTVAPLAFLSAVALAQLWHKLTDTILHASLSTIRDLENAWVFVPQVGVNFAQSDLEDPQLITRTLWALDQFNLQPDRLSVEVLETVVVQDAASPVRNSVNTLAKFGCHIDLDDFGTAQNPFNSLRQLNIDRMKIDRSFILNIDREPKKQDMLAAVVLLAQRLNLNTIAEGIETNAELRLAQNLAATTRRGSESVASCPLINC